MKPHSTKHYASAPARDKALAQEIADHPDCYCRAVNLYPGHSGKRIAKPFAIERWAPWVFIQRMLTGTPQEIVEAVIEQRDRLAVGMLDYRRRSQKSNLVKGAKKNRRHDKIVAAFVAARKKHSTAKVNWIRKVYLPEVLPRGTGYGVSTIIKVTKHLK